MTWKNGGRDYGYNPKRDRFISAKESAGALDPTQLYLGDNGRVFCGRLEHAGVTAYFSGRGLSGMKVERLSESEAKRMGLRCEVCRNVVA